MKTSLAVMPKQPKIALALIVFLGIWVMLMFGFSLFHQLGDIPFEWNLLYLLKIVSSDALTNHYFWETLLAAFVLFPIAVACRWFPRQIGLYRKWNVYFRSNLDPAATRELNERFAAEGVRIEVVANDKWIAATTGLWKPKIVLSASLVALFPDEEIEAILHHEIYHYKYRHPLQFLILTMIAESLAFLPIIKGLLNNYRIWTELLADRYALHRMGNEIQLVQALLKMLKSNSNAVAVQGVHFADEAVSYRIRQLIDPEAELHIPLCESRSLMTSLGIIALMILIILVGCV